MTSDNRPPPPGKPADSRSAAPTRRLSSGELFAGATQVVIEHQGAEYCLRITRQDKLILTK